MEKALRRNLALNTGGEALFGFKANLIASVTVLTILLRDYGASERMIGALWSIETAGALIPQLLGLYIFRTYDRRKRQVIMWHIVAMLPVLAVMSGLTFLAPRLDPWQFRWGMLLCHAYFWFSIGVVSAAWSDFVAGIFPARFRGSAMGLAMFASAFAGVGGALTAGYVIRTASGVHAFAWLYAAAWILGTIAMLLWFPVDDLGLRSRPAPPQPSVRGLARIFLHSLSDRNFRAFLVARILATVGFCIVPFIALWFMSEQGGSLSKSTVVSSGAALTFGFAIGSLVVGPLGDRCGHRLGVLAGIGMQILALLTVLFLPGLLGCVLTYGFAGLCNASGVVSHYNMIFETCPHDHRMAHISISNLVIGTPMASAAIGAGLIAELSSLRVVFFICLALSVVAFIWCFLCVREPRSLTILDPSTNI